jgi:hypothetical protein
MIVRPKAASNEIGWRKSAKVSYLLTGQQPYPLRCRLILRGFDQSDFGGGYLAQGGDDFLVIGFDQGTRPLEELLGAPRRTQYQLETIRNDLEAIFHSNSRHYGSIVRLCRDLVNAPFATALSGARDHFSAGRPVRDH